VGDREKGERKATQCSSMETIAQRANWIEKTFMKKGDARRKGDHGKERQKRNTRCTALKELDRSRRCR